MLVNERYFRRLEGNWSFETQFTILSWIGLFQSQTSTFNKLRLAAFTLSQAVFGRYQMETKVEFSPVLSQLTHTTIVKKFGIPLLRSEKTFLLHPNGFDLELLGEEFYWPLTKMPIPFSPMKGRVHPSATRAEYEMPLAGLITSCESVMEFPQAFIRIRLPWFEALFEFTKESMTELTRRADPNISPTQSLPEKAAPPNKIG